MNINCCLNLTPHPAMHCVYILRTVKTKELYYGYTSNLKQRLAEHNRKQECELIYYEAYRAESDARNREKRLKHYAQALTALKSRLRGSLK